MLHWWKVNGSFACETSLHASTEAKHGIGQVAETILKIIGMTRVRIEPQSCSFSGACSTHFLRLLLLHYYNPGLSNALCSL